MAQTPEGRKKATATLLAKDPDYFKKLGKIKHNRGAGFAIMDKAKHKEISAKGGSISRRKKTGY